MCKMQRERAAEAEAGMAAALVHGDAALEEADPEAGGGVGEGIKYTSIRHPVLHTARPFPFGTRLNSSVLALSSLAVILSGHHRSATTTQTTFPLFTAHRGRALPFFRG